MPDQSLDALGTNDVLRRVADAANELNRANNLPTIYNIVNNWARDTLGGGFTFVSSRDEVNDAMRLEVFSGLEGRIDEVIKLVGLDFRATTYPLAAMTPGELAQYRSARLELLEGGLYRLLVGKVPQPVCHALEAMFGVEGIYTQGFVWDGVHYGGLFVASKRALVEPVRPMLETIVSHASSCIHRIRAEEDLSLHKFAVDEASTHVVWNDGAGRVQYFNRSAALLRGWVTDDGASRAVSDFYASLPPEEWASLWARLQRERLVSLPTLAVRARDGTRRELETTFHLLTTRNGAIAVSFSEDVTDRVLLEEQLRQSQKMEAVGQLAGGVAHDFNNILAVIVSSAELLTEDLPADSPLVEDVRAIADAAERARKLTTQLLAFSRRGLAVPTSVRIDDAVTSMEEMIRRTVGEQVTVEAVLDAPDAHALIDPNHLDQTLLNLAVNARDAMPGGGHLTLRTRIADVVEPLERVHGEVPIGRYVVVEVSDTGTGMSEAVQRRIFEPFFTTKARGKGTGLGLATVWGIVRQAHGHVVVDSTIDQGSTLAVYLPEHFPSSAAQPVARRVRSVPGGSATILLVEDEPEPRRVVRRMLERQGHQVFDAASGTAALKLLDGGLPPIDLLLTDVMMPGMTGRQLAEGVVERLGPIPVLYMSGYAREVLGNGVLDDGLELLAKPFSQQELAVKLAQALAGSPRPSKG